MKIKDFYEDVKGCIWFNPNKKNYRCDSRIVDNFDKLCDCSVSTEVKEDWDGCHDCDCLTVILRFKVSNLY